MAEFLAWRNILAFIVFL